MPQAEATTRTLDLCIVRPTLGQGGADRVTLTLLRALDRRRFRPTLVLLRAEGALLTELPGDVPVHDLGGRSLWTAWLPLTRLLRRLQPHVLFSTSSGTNIVVAIANLLLGRPSRLILSERTPLTQHRDKRIRRWLQRRLKRRLYPSADRVTAVSQGVAEDLVRRLGLPSELVTVVANPVVTPELEELAAAAVEHPWFAERQPIVLGVGRLIRTKGFDDLIRAVAASRAELGPRLVILGDGPEKESLAELAESLGLANRLLLPGFDVNPFRFMARATVFVLSSRLEGLPGALIQAMACGCPVVATDCHAGPAEIVDDQVTGLLTPVDDPKAMAARIDRLLADDELRDTMAARARRDVVRRFSLDVAIESYSEALTP